jgi:hypothetical protein
MRKYLILLAILPLLAIILAGCAPTGGPTGAVAVYVTDPGPTSNITSINITASEVQIHKAADGGEEGKWISLNIDAANSTFDLIALRDGELEHLAQGNVTAGNYTQIRIAVEEVEVTLDGETQNVTVPSDELKLVRAFRVAEGNTTALTVDFHTNELVTVTGAGEVKLHPVIGQVVTVDVIMQPS